MQLIITADTAIVPTPGGRAELALFLDTVTATVQEAAAARARIEEFGEDVISMDSGEIWSTLTQHRRQDL